jgi:hypothetical protein
MQKIHIDNQHIKNPGAAAAPGKCELVAFFQEMARAMRCG